MSSRKVKTAKYFCQISPEKDRISWHPARDTYNHALYDQWKKHHDMIDLDGAGMYVAVECDYVEEEDGTVCILSIRY